MKMHFIFALACIGCLGVTAQANEATYVNNTGCTVTAEQHANGTIYRVQQDGERSQTVGVTSDLKSANFAYCAQEVKAVNSISGVGSTEIMISCSEHQNGETVTRGRVDIDLDSKGAVRSISIDGQVKGFLGFWKQDSKIVCENLEMK